MIEFKLASTGSHVHVAHVQDKAVYLFTMKDDPPNTWRVTCNALGIVGATLSMNEGDSMDVTVAATLHLLRDAIDVRVHELQQLAAEMLTEAKARLEPHVSIPASEPKP